LRVRTWKEKDTDGKAYNKFAQRVRYFGDVGMGAHGC
jgi:hypothetical protein